MESGLSVPNRIDLDVMVLRRTICALLGRVMVGLGTKEVECSSYRPKR